MVPDYRQRLADIDRIGACRDHEFIGCYPLLVADIERDFRAEEERMDALDAAAYRAQMEQFARILAALHCTACCAEYGDTGPARAALTLLRIWMRERIACLHGDGAATTMLRKPPPDSPPHSSMPQ